VVILSPRSAQLIYNPNAGTIIRKKHLFDSALGRLRQQGFELHLNPTQAAGHATELARRAVDSGAGMIIAAGGDGTVNEVLNGMVGSNVPLAVLPCGTANVFACETGIGTNPDRAARLFPDLVPRRISVGLLEATGPKPRYFLLMAGCGLDAEVLHYLNEGWKRKIGKLAYWAAGFSMLTRRLPLLRASVSGADHVTAFALASRVRNYGGDLVIAAGASLLSDDFELVTFRGSNPLPFIAYLGGAVFGKAALVPGVSVTRARTLRCEPVSGRPHVQVDGEPAGMLPAEIRIVPSALTILLPAGVT